MVDRVSYEGSYDAAFAELPYAMACANVVSNMKHLLRVDRLSKSFDSPDGTQVYVIDLEHQRVIHIIPPTALPDVEYHEPEWPELGANIVGVPDYVSGAVLNPVIDQAAMHLPGDDMSADPITYPVIREHLVTERTAGRIPFDMARYKLAVQEHTSFAKPGGSGPQLIYSQHRSLKPGLYSGAMRPLMQILLGVGRVRPETFEQRWIDEDPENRRPIAFMTRESEGDDPSAPQRDYPESAFGLGSDAQYNPVITFDYRFNRTHGISWGSDGKAYIVEIGQRGVLIMPLLVDPVSETEAGRKRYENLFPELFDPSWWKGYPGGTFFDAFGGFPVNRPIPNGEDDLDRLIRSGEVARVLDRDEMARFYSNSSYSSSLGWAFRPDGSVAQNTCHGFEGKFRVGYHFAVSMQIGDYADIEPPAEAVQVIARLSLSGADRRKALRMTKEQAQQVMAVFEQDAAKELFDSMSVKAQIVASANLLLQKKGFLFHPNPFRLQPQIKFPEPLLDAILSFDFTVEGLTVQEQIGLVCDTPMFVCYQGASLSVLNYAGRYASIMPPVTLSTRQECQFVGSWEVATSAEGPSVKGYFYGSDGDWRDNFSGGKSVRRKTTGSYVGRTAFLEYCTFFAMHSVSYWEYWHSYVWEEEETDSRGMTLSAAIPNGDRSIYYIGRIDWRLGVKRSNGYQGASMSGRGTGRAEGIVHHPVWHWTGGCPSPWIQDSGPVDCRLREFGEPYQVDGCFHDEVTVAITPYNPCPIGPFAGLGMRFGHVPTGGSYTNTQPVVNEFEFKIHIFGDTALHGTVIKEGSASGEAIGQESISVSDWWQKSSPDDFGQLAQLDLSVNRFGSDLIAYQDDIGGVAQWAGKPDEMHVSPYSCFVGWVA